MKRRILFLHYILNEDGNSILNRFLVAQVRSQKKNDWIYQVQNDLKKLNLNQDMEILKQMKKSKLKMELEKLIKELIFKELNMKKANHSKVKDVPHTKFEMQNYLKANQLKITQEEAREIFKLRCRVTDVKSNFKSNYENIDCENCYEEENQQHVLTCKILNKLENDEIPEYDEILKNNVKNQLQIAKKFIKNMKIRKKSNKI